MHKSFLIKIINYSFFLLATLLAFLFFREEMLDNMLAEMGEYVSIYKNYILLLLSFFLFACILFGRWSGHFLSWWYLFLTLFNVSITLVNGPVGTASIPTYIAVVAGIMLPFLFYNFMYNAAFRLSKKIVLTIVLVLFAALALVYVINLKSVLYLMVIEDFRCGAPYVFLMSLPFLLIVPNKYIKWIGIFLTFVCIASSMKRGGLITYIIAIMAYVITDNFVKKNGMASKKIIAFIALLIFFVIVLFIADFLTEGYIFDRFSSISDDGGSKRDVVYSVTINMILNSDFIEILKGHGWNSVVYYSTLSKSAHNDFLEMFYDCGIFSFIGLVGLILVLCRTCKELCKRCPDIAPAFVASVIVFILNSMMSHVYLYAWYITTLSMFWGYCIGIMRKREIDSVI